MSIIAKYKFNNTLSDCLPEFNEGFIYTYTDEVNGTVTTRTIESDDDFTGCSFNGKTNLLSVEYLKVTDKVTNMQYMFNGCKSLTSLDVSGFDTSNVTQMHYMFQNCSNLTSLDLSGFDTSKVTRMDYMFYGCESLTSLDLSGFDIAEVTNIGSMFANCSKLKEIGLIYANIETINKISTLVPQVTIFIDLNLDTTDYTGMALLKAYKEFATTITLTTSLKKVGDKADRLYWDDTDKCYYIEQWIDPNTNTVLSTPNKIASAISLPINMKVFDSTTSVCTLNCEPSYMKCTVPYFEIPNDYEYNEADELEYIKQSFELRYPDEEDVVEGWGFMGVDEEINVIDYQPEIPTNGSRRLSTIMKVSAFTFPITVETEDGKEVTVTCFDSSRYHVETFNVKSGESFTTKDNVVRFNFNHVNGNTTYIIINGIKYYYGDVYTENNYQKDPYVRTVKGLHTGLKALIDWVDNCTDEEFVNDFEEHFQKDYTLRYFCLVTLVGAVDNLGGQYSCRV